jgi:hypothetical protein
MDEFKAKTCLYNFVSRQNLKAFLETKGVQGMEESRR